MNAEASQTAMLTAHRSKRQSVDGTWEADKDAKNCAVCEAKFSMTKLKYHCRVQASAHSLTQQTEHAKGRLSYHCCCCLHLCPQMCGKVVCNACSKNREHLPGVSRSGQVRVSLVLVVNHPPAMLTVQCVC